MVVFEKRRRSFLKENARNTCDPDAGPSEIILWLQTYQDLFSSFDSRPYDERAVSDDLIVELKRASRDKLCGPLKLTFVLSPELRDQVKERAIKRRLQDHFEKHHRRILNEVHVIKRHGFQFLALGTLIISGTAYLAWKIASLNTSFLPHLLIVLGEPAGWFTFWSGLDELVFSHQAKHADRDFYAKMAVAEISFKSESRTMKANL